MRGGLPAWVALALLLHAPVVPAQVLPPGANPGAIQQRRMEEERLQRQEEELRRKRTDKPVDPGPAKPPPPPADGTEVRFLVREIEFSASELLRPEELEALAAPLRGKTLSIADLRALVAQVNELYRSKGIVTAQAILPPQDLSAGVVRIRLIEGRVGKVSVQGNATTNEGYVTARVRQRPGDLVVLPSLEEDLKRFNRTNDAQVRAELKPGAEVGQTDVLLLLSEPPLHEGRAVADNAGSLQTGEYRAGLSYRNRSLFGRRDELLVGTVQAEGQASYSLSYGLPVTTLGTRLQGAYYDDRTEVKNGDLASLNLNGESSAVVLSLRHPLLVSDAAQADVVLGSKQRQTINRIDSIVLQETTTRDLSVGVEGQAADSNGSWIASLTWLTVKSVQLAAPSRSFRILRGNLRRSQLLTPGYALVGSFAWQYSEDEFLPSSEQFLLGGEGSVRGYLPGIVGGDRGYTVNLELHHPLLVHEGEGPGWRGGGFFFFDYGAVRPFRAPADPRPDSEALSGVGWGAGFEDGRRFSIRGAFAVQRRERPEDPQGYRLHLQAAWLFL